MSDFPRRLLLTVSLAVAAPPAHTTVEPETAKPPLPLAQPAEQSEPPVPSQDEEAGNAGFTLNLSPERQRMAGLQTGRLAQLSLRPEANVSGKVLDLQGLLDLRARYQAARSELIIAEAQLRVAQKSFQRLSALHHESIIATRDLIQSEALLIAERARCESLRRRLREIREEALQAWGSELFHQVVEQESALLRQLVARDQVLILVSLPSSGAAPEPRHSVTISPFTDRRQALEAILVSAAPRTDEATQGETWFFTAPAAHLRSGMRLDVWLPQDDELRSGVAIPLAAVVWHAGKPWVYVKTGEQTFTRRSVGRHLELGGAWFVEQGFSAGQELVVNGGQILLSEELRQQIPAEDDD